MATIWRADICDYMPAALIKESRQFESFVCHKKCGVEPSHLINRLILICLFCCLLSWFRCAYMPSFIFKRARGWSWNHQWRTQKQPVGVREFAGTHQVFFRVVLVHSRCCGGVSLLFIQKRETLLPQLLCPVTKLPTPPRKKGSEASCWFQKLWI